MPNGNINGGGIWSDISATITNSTITDNEAAGANSAGGVFTFRHSHRPQHDHRRQPQQRDHARCCRHGVFTSQGYNLIGNVGAVTDFNQTGDQTGTGGAGNQIDPLLAPLAANGGAATPTHALMFGSPALDKGNCFGCSLDQRLRTRPFDDPNTTPAASGDNSDIGAFELSTLKVTSNNDDGTAVAANCPGAGCRLRDALAAVAEGDAIYFDAALSGQAITLNGELLVDKSVHISGLGADQLAVSGNDASRVFHIAPGTTVTISGLTIRNGLAEGSSVSDKSGGGIYNNQATLTLADTTVSSNYAGTGGGIYNEGTAGSATLTLTNSTIASNAAGDLGAGIYNDGSNGGNAT